MALYKLTVHLTHTTGTYTPHSLYTHQEYNDTAHNMGNQKQREQGGLAHKTWWGGQLALIQGALMLGMAVEAPGGGLLPLEMPHYITKGKMSGRSLKF